MVESTFLPRFFDDSRLHLGFALALVMAAVVHFLVRRTTLGFELRAIGVNKRAASYKGISVGAAIIAVHGHLGGTGRAGGRG